MNMPLKDEFTILYYWLFAAHPPRLPFNVF
jgi:hypothetical protein